MNETSLTLYSLGSEGWFPSNGQETICFAFMRADELVIIDAGTGICRLMDLQRTLFKGVWPKIKAAHIFLSHYHFDHVIGLFWVPAILRSIPVTIYAPGESVYQRPAMEILDDFFRKPFAPRPFRDHIPGVEVRELNPPDPIDLQLGSESIKVGLKLNARHSDPSVSLRFGDWFAFVTDTPPEDKTIEFIKGVKVLLHEAYFDSSAKYGGEEDELEKHIGGPHTGSFGAGLVAKRAGIDRLYLIHHNPEGTMIEVETAAKNVTNLLGIDCRPARDLGAIEIT